MNGYGIGSMETTNAIFDEKLYKYCTPNTVPSFIVVMIEKIRDSVHQVCNVLAKDPKTWVDMFEMYNSGTYNNQVFP